MEKIEIIIAVIGVISPVLIEIIKFCVDKNKDKLSNNIAIAGNDNYVQQGNSVKIINNYYNVNNYTQVTKKKDNSNDIMIGACIFAILLSPFFIDYSEIIRVIYLVSFTVLMIVSCFSPQNKKNYIINFIINFVLLVLSFIFNSQSYWSEDMISLYSSFKENYNIVFVIENLITNKIDLYVHIRISTLILLNMFLCGSAIAQVLINLVHIITCKIKGVTENSLKRLYNFSIYLNIFPIACVLFNLLIMLMQFVIKKINQ